MPDLVFAVFALAASPLLYDPHIVSTGR